MINHGSAQTSWGKKMKEKAWWQDRLDQYGPVLLVAAMLFGVVLGWVPSPMLSAISAMNEAVKQINANNRDWQRVMSEIQAQNATVQQTMADAQKMIAATSAARELRLDSVAKGIRINCRIMAKIARSQEANEKCDDL